MFETKLQITERYLLLPVKKGSAKAKLHFYIGEEKLQEIDLYPGGKDPDLYAVMDLFLIIDHGILEYFSEDGLLYGAAELTGKVTQAEAAEMSGKDKKTEPTKEAHARRLLIEGASSVLQYGFKES